MSVQNRDGRPTFCFIVALSVALSSCQRVYWPSGNACPVIDAKPSNESAGIIWGGQPAKVEAQIVSLAVECLPNHHPAVETNRVKQAAYSDYQIAATATVTCRIHDNKYVESMQSRPFGDLGADIVFEAVSASGVVLGSGQGRFRVVQNATSSTVSGHILELSDSAIRRVVAVRARWEYGR